MPTRLSHVNIPKSEAQSWFSRIYGEGGNRGLGGRSKVNWKAKVESSFHPEYKEMSLGWWGGRASMRRKRGERSRERKRERREKLTRS